ncbi:XRE family transcriptional regulator [Kribbella sp. NPDC051587]|uniref:XRE family transcriptional regulator n=1 Tax=Kribbella sp. NPDC051587 TaxID=3364119 RepID=UPI00379C6FD4
MAGPHDQGPIGAAERSAGLTLLLRDGPFPAALRAAIAARGLSLERIKQRLCELGAPVTIATLSYWQSGRSRPERGESLVALEHLETMLNLPGGSLTALLGPPRPRGRGLGHLADGGLGFTALWEHPESISNALHSIDTHWDERLTCISQHDVVVVGADGEERSALSRQVLRAQADGPDRWVLVVHLDDHNSPLPLVKPLRRCRLGRLVNRQAEGIVIAELLFDHPLARGETIMTEHALVNRPPYPTATNFERKFRLPVRLYALEVNFDKDALPCRPIRVTRAADGTEHREPVELDNSDSLHGVALNFGPGCYGFQWDGS